MSLAAEADSRPSDAASLASSTVGRPDLPFGGVGPSGMGADHGRESFETFGHRKPVGRKSTWIDPGIIYPPYGKLKTRIVEKMI